MKVLLYFLLLAIGLYAIWDIYLAEHPLPHRTTLTAASGDSAEVDILQATAQEVRFRLVKNGAVYDWPMDKLSIASRYKAYRLIHSSKKANEAKIKNSPTAQAKARQQERTSIYVQNLREQIAANDKRIQQLQTRYSEARARRVSYDSAPTADERAIIRQIDDLENQNSLHRSRIQLEQGDDW